MYPPSKNRLEFWIDRSQCTLKAEILSDHLNHRFSSPGSCHGDSELLPQSTRSTDSKHAGRFRVGAFQPVLMPMSRSKRQCEVELVRQSSLVVKDEDMMQGSLTNRGPCS